MKIPPESIEAFTERVDTFIETLGEYCPSTDADAINALAQEVSAPLENRQNGMNILALSVAVAHVLRKMDREHRAIALVGFVKLVLKITEENAP